MGGVFWNRSDLNSEEKEFEFGEVFWKRSDLNSERKAGV